MLWPLWQTWQSEGWWEGLKGEARLSENNSDRKRPIRANFTERRGWSSSDWLMDSRTVHGNGAMLPWHHNGDITESQHGDQSKNVAAAYYWCCASSFTSRLFVSVYQGMLGNPLQPQRISENQCRPAGHSTQIFSVKSKRGASETSTNHIKTSKIQDLQILRQDPVQTWKNMTRCCLMFLVF